MLYVLLRVTHSALVKHSCTYEPFAAEPQLQSLLFPSLYLCRMIFVTLYLMVWDWDVLRAESMLFYWHKQLIPSLSFTVFHGLVLCSWGLRTDEHLAISPSFALMTFFNKDIRLICNYWTTSNLFVTYSASLVGLWQTAGNLPPKST